MSSEAALTLQAQIAEAKLAKHQLAMGKQLVTLSYSAEGTNTQQWSPASLPVLERHIAQLEADLARLTGIGRRRPIYIS
ncbi:gpW family head-tail joining protein [Agrobacterium sp.]|uniref:gpW family head-tail joining protein n=1 Tax=Agrobacterium sp. TaxID=361 RepID=UPI000DB58C41|nr:gpW family head-tail joining protein [Agrobacterium sp.]PZU78205.1 MAG: hypothetical protein DI546_04395 [Rhizobium sp.]